ncbi:MAG: hypothetical protein AB8F78_04465 [Saprospiraceae bacterium]
MKTQFSTIQRLTSLLLTVLSLTLLPSCSCEEPLPIGRANPQPPASERCGYTVATFYAPRRRGAVAIIFDTRNTGAAPRGALWQDHHSNTIQGPEWNALDIGQVFGTAIDSNDNVYLASSDIYFETGGNSSLGIVSGNSSRPNPPARIFKFSPPTFNLVSSVDLPSSISPLNGIGNIAYNRIQDQLFATNIEDGIIYRISSTPSIIDSYDPFNPDGGTPGIAPLDERIWGIGINQEATGTKVYFSRVSTSGRSIYSITLLATGGFPAPGSEIEEISNIPGDAPIIADIAFSSDGENMLLAEHGSPDSASVIRYSLISGAWTLQPMVFVGGSANASALGTAGTNTGGGVDFGQAGTEATPNQGCDQLIWASGNYLSTGADTSSFIGLQGISVNGNQMSTFGQPSANLDTDIFIDYDNQLSVPETFGAPGDVESFDCGICGGSSLSDYLGG